MAPHTFPAVIKNFDRHRAMNANVAKGETTRKGDPLPAEDDCEISKNKRVQTVKECKISASNNPPFEGACCGQVEKCSNSIHVQSSSDIHIGDRTYLTIHQASSASVDDLKQIIAHVVGSPSVRTEVDVKTDPERPGYSSGAFVKGLNLVKEANSNVGDGVRLPILDLHQNESGKKKKNAADCGTSTKVVVIVIAAVVSAMTTAGLMYTAVHLTAHRQTTESEESDAPTHWDAGDEQSSIGRVHSTGNGTVSSWVLPPSERRRGWRPVGRDDWGSWTPVASTPSLLHPLGLVIVAHTAGGSCETVAGCRNKVRDLQDYSVSQMSMPDIPYNFLVGRDGNAYEGVGWDHEATFSKKYSNCSISIAYVGNYIHLEPTPQQLQATKNILALGVELKKLAPHYMVVAHNLTANTLSPGRSVYKQISALPHFTSDDSLLPF